MKVAFEIVELPPAAGELARWYERMWVEQMRVREELYASMVQPRPSWLPQRVWLRLVGRVIAFRQVEEE